MSSRELTSNVKQDTGGKEKPRFEHDGNYAEGQVERQIHI